MLMTLMFIVLNQIMTLLAVACLLVIYFGHMTVMVGKNLGLLEKVLRLFRFFRFQCTKTGHKIVTHKFTENISYMISPSSYHAIYSHV